jgi:hypothetical protein
MKHLYLRKGKTKEHSKLCWCEQITRLQNKSIEETVGWDEYEMLYPHEADEIYCRCPLPSIKRVHLKQFGKANRPPDLEVCILCGKPLEKKV